MSPFIRPGCESCELEPRLAPALVASLVANLTPDPGGYPEGLAECNGYVYFAANSVAHGRELWRTDGTANGTTLVKDIQPGPASASPGPLFGVGGDPGIVGEFVNVNGTLFFPASTDLGRELWKSDGTSSGTVLVKDITPAGFGGIAYLANLNGTLYFSISDGVHGNELWRSDGTSAGTLMVADILPGNQGSLPGRAAALNGAVYFTANTPGEGRELWRTTGTGATLVRDVNPGSGNGVRGHPIRAGNTLFFIGNNPTTGAEIWKTDGTSTGTVLVSDITPGYNFLAPYFPTNFNGTLIFSARDPNFTGNQLWTSDGTSAGTNQVTFFDSFKGDLTNLNSDEYSEVGVAGDWFYYSVKRQTSTPDQFLRAIDGNGNIRTLLALPPSFDSPRSTNFTAVGSTMYFQHEELITGRELWRSDATSTGTVLVQDLTPGSANTSVGSAAALGNSLIAYLGRGDSNTVSAAELYKAAPAGLTPVATFVSAAKSTAIGPIVPVGSTYFFSTNASNTGVELWASNGTSSGTRLVRDIRPGSDSSDPQHLTAFGSKLYFTANDGSSGRELWVSDGTSSGTMLVADHTPGTASSNFDALTVVGSTLYFAGNAPGGANRELYKTTGSGLTLVREINATALGSYPAGLANVRGTLFFTANNGSTGHELWKSNGTSTGTVLVADIFPGSEGSVPDQITANDPFSDSFYFAASSTSGGGDRELWFHDGAATTRLRDINPGFGTSIPRNLTLVTNGLNRTLFFSANDGVNGIELWKSDGTSAGTGLVRDIRTGSAGSSLANFKAVNGKLFFVANDGASGAELWTSDGTSSGTLLVTDARPGSLGANPDNLTTIQNGFTQILLYTADDGSTGQELWTSLGAAADTRSLDLNPGPAGSSPGSLASFQNRLLLAADLGTFGVELVKVENVPNVGAPVPNPGNPQRSRITSVQVTFSAALDVTLFQNPGAVTLTRTLGGPPTVVTIGSGLVVAPGAGNSTTITLTFQNLQNSGVEFGSLADGRWRLAIPSLNYQSNLNDPNLRRLFGDGNADGTVDGNDLAAFGAAFGSTGFSAFDFNNDNTVDALDFGEFGSRFGLTL